MCLWFDKLTIPSSVEGLTTTALSGRCSASGEEETVFLYNRLEQYLSIDLKRSSLDQK